MGIQFGLNGHPQVTHALSLLNIDEVWLDSFHLSDARRY
jgi:hypothetical protein